MFTWAEGNIYKGDYVNDLREGFGEMFWTDGTVFKGSWKADQQIEVEQNSIIHDQDCELLLPTTKPYLENEFPFDGDLQRFYLQ